MPCIVRDITYDEAVIMMVDANLQREVILPSEKAQSYKMKLDAIKRQQGERADLTSAPLEQKSVNKSSREIIAEDSPDSHSQIQRYIRLTELNSPMLDMVDKGQIAMRPAVELSYLPQEEQQLLLDVIGREDRTPSHVQATKLRKLSNEGHLDYGAIVSIIKEETPPRAEHFKLPKAKIQQFFPADTPAPAIEETIIKALELWHKSQ
jgi:ParB family chromosome partitioning protein